MATNVVVALLVLLLFNGCRKRPQMAVEWYLHQSDEQTWQMAQQQGKPVLLAFETGWCPYCQQLTEKVFTEPNVVSRLQQFFCVRVDGDRDNANALMKRYAVKGYPTLIFTRPDGEPLAAWQDAPDAAAFTAQLESILASPDPHASWAVYTHDALPAGELPADPFFDRAHAIEESGEREAARAEYAAGGMEMLKRINQTTSLEPVRSLLGPTIQLLVRGQSLQEAEALARRAIAAFPDDFLYYHRLAGVLDAQGRGPEAVAAGEGAYARAFGRNRVWVTEQLSDLLMKQGKRERAASVIREALAGVDWATNTRQKELRGRGVLEARLHEITTITPPQEAAR